MDNIIEPNEQFPFSKLSLTLPSGIQGGAYFTKIQFNNKPLYIQTTTPFIFITQDFKNLINFI